MRPASKKDAPDPANAYERAHSEREAGMGRLDNNDDATPTCCPDRMEQTVKHRQENTRQLNAGDAINQRGGAVKEQPTHSMHEEAPTDPDLAPQDIENPRDRRHPRTGGKGGTPDAGEPDRKG
jgi:hypothetical protein